MADFETIPDAPTDEGADGVTVLVTSARHKRVGNFYWDQRYSALTVPGSLQFSELVDELNSCLAAVSAWKIRTSDIAATIVSQSSETPQQAEGPTGLQSFHFSSRKPSVEFLQSIAGFSEIDFVRFDLEINGSVHRTADVPFSVASDSSKFDDCELIVRIPAGVDWTKDLLAWQVAHARAPVQIEPSLFEELNRLKLSRQQVGESW
jgi:hypothetical protein